MIVKIGADLQAIVDIVLSDEKIFVEFLSLIAATVGSRSPDATGHFEVMGDLSNQTSSSYITDLACAVNDKP